MFASVFYLTFNGQFVNHVAGSVILETIMPTSRFPLQNHGQWKTRLMNGRFSFHSFRHQCPLDPESGKFRWRPCRPSQGWKNWKSRVYTLQKIRLDQFVSSLTHCLHLLAVGNWSCSILPQIGLSLRVRFYTSPVLYLSGKDKSVKVELKIASAIHWNSRWHCSNTNGCWRNISSKSISFLRQK